MYRCMTDPGYLNLMTGYGYASVPLAWLARDTGDYCSKLLVVRVFEISSFRKAIVEKKSFLIFTR